MMAVSPLVATALWRMPRESLAPSGEAARAQEEAPDEDAPDAQAAQSAAATPQQQAEIARLQATDREVRQHEQAHMAAGAGLVTSGAHYTTVRGPDGHSYAVAGEVGIDTSQGRTPQDTLLRAQQIQAAALAPAQPSGQDQAVAAAAAQMALQARIEIAQQALTAEPAGVQQYRRALAPLAQGQHWQA